MMGLRLPARGRPEVLALLSLLLLLLHRAYATGTGIAASSAPPSGAPPQPQPQPPPAEGRPGLPPMPLSTRGRHIVDARGQRVKLKCASWSGGQEAWHAPSGLWAAHRSSIAALARSAGLNCVRLVFSLELVLGWPGASVPAQALAANKDLVGRRPLEVLDAVVAALEAEGLMVVLDNHTSDAMWCCGLDGNGLWYTARWSERQWLDGWREVARRYRNVTAVVGAGLRNEPRPAIVGGVLRVPSWGAGPGTSDFAIAYEKAAAAVLAERPATLIFAQGLWAGRDLRPARLRPLVLRESWPLGRVVPGRLVYEVHEYPFLWGDFDFSDYASYSRRLDEAWGFVFKGDRAPVWVGEFGVEHTAAGVGGAWFRALLRYIKEHDLEWSYWPLDGQQGASRQQGAEETYGLLNTTWSGWAYAPLMEQLRGIM